MQRSHLLNSVKRFLEQRGLLKQPLLLGYSGGPDSRALLHLLGSLDCTVHVAHLDHSWREESFEEAMQLRAQVEQMGIPFYLKRVDFQGDGDWENRGREARIEFFLELYQKLKVSALVLGHHADDRAEVVLKRLFEGAHFSKVGSFSSDTHLKGMRLLRPLFTFSKKQIVSWLQKQGISYLEDPTNEQTLFLRGKMRTEIIPLIASSFGKQITPALCKIAEETSQISAYFFSLNERYLSCIDEKGTLDLRKDLPLPCLQLRYLLREWADQEGVLLSYEQLASAASALLEGASCANFISGEKGFQVRRGIICLKKE